MTATDLDPKTQPPDHPMGVLGGVEKDQGPFPSLVEIKERGKSPINLAGGSISECPNDKEPKMNKVLKKSGELLEGLL